MKPFSRTTTLLIGLAGTFPTAAPANPELASELAPRLQEAVDQRVTPGGVLVIGRRDALLLQLPFGRLTYDVDSPAVQLDTLYDLASVSKVAGTMACSILLMERGDLDSSATVSRYLPDFAANGKESVTVADLMLHCSGLKAYENNATVERTRSPGESPADALQRTYAALAPSYPPRTDHIYSCLNFQVLARINEVQSGIRQEDYLIDNLYLPLGMTETFYRVPEALQPRIAPTGLGAPAADVHDPLARYHGTAAHCPGNAGLFSTAPDLARFCAWVLRDGEPLLRPGLLRSTTGNASPPGVGNRRGLGWDIFDDPPYTTPEHHASRTPVIGHTGYTGTMIWIDTRSGHYFVLLTNRVFPSDSPESSKGIIALRKAVAKATLALGEVRDEEASR